MIAIDLGSNTLRVLAYDCQTQQTLFSYEKVVKTADGLASYGSINEQAVLRIIAAIKEVQNKIHFSSHSIIAVTTEALRRASNANAVLTQIEKETGICFEIISGETEATLTLLAVKYRLTKLQYDSESFVLMDIGGGSTEIIFHYPNETFSKSFPIGIVTIAQSYKNLKHIQKALSHEMLALEHFIHEIYLNKGKVSSFVATAGTPTTVAAMKLGLTYESYDASKINGTSLEKDELDTYLTRLLAMPFDAREIAVGTGRSDLITAGILIYKQLFILLKFEHCVVIDDGLREGVALKKCLA